MFTGTDSNLPPSDVLEALQQQRRRQIHDACVQDLIRQWKRLDQPIEYADLNQVADLIEPGFKPDAKTRAKIVAAVEAAGIRINNFDGYRRMIAERGMHVSPTFEAMVLKLEEWRWRYPYEYENRPTTQQVRTAMAVLIEKLAAKHDKSQTPAT